VPPAEHSERPRGAGRALKSSLPGLLLLALAWPGPSASAGPVPHRIVALAPSAAEILFALGAGDRVVAVSDLAADLPGAAGKLRTGGFVPDLERVVALAPDLVIASRDGTDRAAYEKLRDLGVHVLATDARNLAGVLADIRRVGEAIGEGAAAERLVASLSARIAAAERRAAARKGPPLRTVAVIWPDPPIVAGPATFIGDLLVRARLVNVVPESAGEWPRVSHETLAAWNPDLVVRPETPENSAAFARAFGEKGRWRLVPAVREGRVVAIPGDLLERPGPRLVDALERLAALDVSGSGRP
jgi:iron complex transport system substrate-binding protein